MRSRLTLKMADRCGGCGATLAVGAEAVQIALPTARLLRCLPCAGPDPEGSERIAATGPRMAARVVDIAERFAPTPRDWKHEQAGDR